MPETPVLGTCDGDRKVPHEHLGACRNWQPIEAPKTYADGLRDAAGICEGN